MYLLFQAVELLLQESLERILLLEPDELERDFFKRRLRLRVNQRTLAIPTCTH